MELRNFAGNEPLKRTLAGMERPPHAIIISGQKGSGRHTLAQLLAQALICEGTGPIPCGQCPSCRKVREGVHPDVMGLSAFVPPEELEKDVRVDTIRAIRADAQIRPNQAPRKVYLIDQPINLPAQNAMLKLLEEGPAYAAFLMITENSAALLETVRSRCALYHTSPVTREQALDYLARRFPERDQEPLSQAADGCQGLIGRAIDLLEGEREEDGTEALTTSWIAALLQRSEWKLMECAAAVQTQKLNRESAQRLYTALGQRFRDGLVAAAGGQAEHPAQAQQLARSFTTRQLLQFHDLAEEAREQCGFYVAPGHSAGWLAVKLQESIEHG